MLLSTGDEMCQEGVAKLVEGVDKASLEVRVPVLSLTPQDGREGLVADSIDCFVENHNGLEVIQVVDRV